jgi:predicted ribosomally synthesized peptide with nif11-like leader
LILFVVMSSSHLRAFVSRLRADSLLREQALQADDCDAMAALARAHGYQVTAVELLKAQAALVLSQSDAVLEQPNAQLRIRHWGCWLDVV